MTLHVAGFPWAAQGYKAFISPLLPPACRFVPTCSEYAIASIQTFGPAKGAVLTAWRILRYGIIWVMNP